MSKADHRRFEERETDNIQSVSVHAAKQCEHFPADPCLQSVGASNRLIVGAAARMPRALTGKASVGIFPHSDQNPG